MAKSWESSPWKWVAVVVIATVIGGVTTAAVQKWWGLMKLQQKSAGAGVLQQGNQGKYQVVFRNTKQYFQKLAKP